MYQATPEQAPISIKKYPNRRFYDSSQSRHVTLEDLHRMIREGQQVQVTDSKTGTDITSRVLAQIILEMDSLKLSIFPSPLLHKLIQSNESIVQEFVDVYFCRALDWFLTSRQAFEDQFRRAVGLAAGDAKGQPTTPHSPGMINAMAAAWQPPNAPPATPNPPTPDDQADLHDKVDQLSKRVENLQAQLKPARRRKT